MGGLLVDRCRVLIVVGSLIPSAAADEQPTTITDVPYRITQPGAYCLAERLTYDAADGAAILIEADDVTLDLQGHTLRGTAGAASGAIGVLAVDRKRVAISNGTIAGFYFGIDLRSDDRVGATSSGHQLARVTLDGNWYFGVRLVGSDSTIDGCTVTSTGGSTRPGHTIPHGIRLVGPRNVLENSCIRDLYLKKLADGKGEIVGVHFDAARDSRMEGNTIVELPSELDDDFSGDPRERRFGVWINGGPKKDTFLTVKHNTFSGFTVPLAFTPGTDGVVKGNTFVGAAAAPIRGRPAAQLEQNRIDQAAIPIACPLPD